MKILIVHRDKTFDESSIKKEFPKLTITKIWKNIVSKNHLKEVDFVIAIGGDGTFLSASHYVENTPILGVNSDVNRSEGALTTIDLSQLNNKIKQIIENKVKIKEYTREKIIIHQKTRKIETEDALNETFFGNINPHHTTNYEISYNHKKENQRSSGLVVSTGTGSTAWYHTAGGFPFNREKKQLRFRIRELYKGKLHKPTVRKGKIKQNEKLTIISKMNHAMIAIDSIRTYAISKHDKIEISIGKPLRVLQ
ncbi:MAG: NAD(+)/NADH kinase [archaeon]